MPTTDQLLQFWSPLTGVQYTSSGGGGGGATVAPAAKLGWMDPQYFVTNTGTKSVSGASNYFTGQVDSYSLSGAPSNVTINPSTGVIAVDTTTGFDWKTVTVQATNAAGSATTTLDLWVFTPNKTVAANAPWSSVSPSPGDIVVVRGGTYTSMQNVSAWDGTSTSNRTRVVAYPGETVTFDCSGMSDYAIETNGAQYVELRGFKLTDDGGCNFGLWNNQQVGCKIAQFDVSGFKKASFAFGQGTKANSGAWTIEYCRIYNNVQENNTFSNPASSRGMALDYCDGSVIRRNRFYQNYGEGFGFVGSSNCTIQENISYDNCSVNIYLDNCAYHEVHGNIVWSNNPSYYTHGRVASSIRAANEDYNGTPQAHTGGKEQATTGLNVTNNFYLSGNDAPQYLAYGGSYDDGGAGTSVFTPNSTFTSVVDVWR